MAETTKLPVGKETAHPTETSPTASDRMRREMDRLFDEFGRGFGFPTRWTMPDIEPFWRTAGRAAAPVVDMVERPDRYEITAELPGLDETNIEVKLSNGNLVISGEKKEDKDERDANYYLSERRYGAFKRSIRLPDGIKAEAIDASFRNGVLTIALPKSEEAKTETRINVKAA